MTDPAWQTDLDRDHPLVGRIWHGPSRRFVAPEEMLADLAGRDFVLLGEKHDHPDHHQLQALVVLELAVRGRRPAVGFEMLEPSQQAPLDTFLAQHPTDAAQLGPAVSWQDSSWPDWELYRPIAQAALDAGLPLFAANLPGADAKAISRNGLAALDAESRKRFALDMPFDATAAAEMEQEVLDSHCGMLPKHAAPPMAMAQRARDAAMADALLAHASPGGAVLITGNGHARKDRGVPWWLRQRAPGKSIASVAFVEVRAGLDPQQGEPGAVADYVWYTPRLDDTDPCAEFRDQLEKMRGR